MKLRITNGTEIDLNDVQAVYRTRTGLRVVFSGGVAASYPRQRLTQAGREALESMAQETPQ